MQSIDVISTENPLRNASYINDFAAYLLGILEDANSGSESDRQEAEKVIAKVSTAMQLPTDQGKSGSDARCTGGLVAWQVNRVKGYIELHLSEEILIEDLSSLIRLSPSHFSRAFKVALGEAPHRYIVQRRLERAKYLLLATKVNLSELALICGFSDQAHLCRMFGKIVGESPALWRRQRNATPPAGDIRSASEYTVELLHSYSYSGRCSARNSSSTKEDSCTASSD